MSVARVLAVRRESLVQTDSCIPSSPRNLHFPRDGFDLFVNRNVPKIAWNEHQRVALSTFPTPHAIDREMKLFYAAPSLEIQSKTENL